MISTIEWTSVEDRLPTKAELVLIGEGAIAYWSGHWLYDTGESVDAEVKYWAEIPALTQSSPLECIATERTKQDAKWGEQNHGDLGWLAILAEEFGEAAECVTELSVSPIDHSKIKSWRPLLKHELTQTAAVCVAWLECIHRREQNIALTAMHKRVMGRLK